jgi:tetratricopeptide (TPR) repeat protein
MVAASVLLLGATPVAQAQATRTPNPNAPRLVVGTLRSADKRLSVQASEELRSRLSADIPFRSLTVLSSADYKQVVEQSGYPYDEALSSGDLGSLAKLLRTDEFVEGSVEKTATGYLLNAKLVLTRDPELSQPLPPAEGDRIARAASALSRSLQEARKQLDAEKKCYALGRDSKPAEAIASARAGVAAFPGATLARLCELGVRVGFKHAPDSIIRIAQEIIRLDPKSKVALTAAAQAYKDKGDNDKYIEALTQLLATDPTNTRLVEDIVNAFAASGKWELAKPVIAQAVKDNPGDVRLMKLAFTVFMNAGDYKTGIPLGEEMVKIDTAAADSAYFVKVVGAYDADSNFAKAAEVAAEAARKFPTNTFFLGTLGQEQLKSGQQAQAVATFRRVLAINPKAPNMHLLIARTFDELKMPDSALVALRNAKSAGEDGQAVGGYALSIGNRLFRVGQDALNKAQQSKTSEDYEAAITANQAVVPWVTFADETVTSADSKQQAKFLLGVATFQIAVAAVSDAPKNKSCSLAKLAQENISIAQINLPAGGRFAPQAVAQLMPVVPQIMQGAEMMVNGDPSKKIKGYCP